MANGIGGMWKSASFTNDIGQKLNFCICWGKVVKEPKIQMFNVKKTSFTMKWYTKQYMQVELWGESDAADVASTLEVGDVILCCGMTTTTRYTVKKGENAGQEKEWYALSAHIIIPMASVVFLNQLFGTRAIHKIIENEVNNKPTDVLESLEDFNTEVQEETNGEEEYSDFVVPDILDCPF